MTVIQELPGKMITTWNAEVKAVIDTWTTYSITLDEMKEAVLIKGCDYSKAHGGIAWIVDSSKAVGVFPQEIQDLIGSTIFPKFVEIGVKYFITIKPEVQGITSLTVRSYSAKAGPCGLQLIDLKSVDDAVLWLKENR